ncbi:MAG TPA: hypothetical protein VEU76_05770 [Candidatus Udaeobacter sp.]|nr:hypothetical protein [Candidatus Udaeobacter sp.]
MKAVIGVAVLVIAACSPSGTSGTATSPGGACPQSTVALNPSVGAVDTTLGREVVIRVTFPNNFSCESPDVMAELEDARGNRLPGVTGNPTLANSAHTCSTNVSDKCSEQTFLYWSNWCGTDPGPYQIAALAFGGRLRATALISSPPPCSNPRAPSKLAGVGF